MSSIVNFYKGFLAQALNEGEAASTIYVDRITNAQGETVTTGDFADFSRGIITINPNGDGLSDFPENASFTAVDSTNLAFTGAVRGLTKAGVTSTSLMRYHPVGTPVVISVGTHNLQDIKTYIDQQIALVAVGTANLVAGTAGETLVAGNLCYLKNDGKWWKIDADTAATIDGVILGIAQGSGATDAAITGGIMLKGLDTHQSGLSIGTTYYASNTAGGISSSVGTNTRAIGVARSSTSLYFDPNFANTPTAPEKSLLSTLYAGLPGMISPYAGRSAPSGWLLCDGSAVSRSTYASLFAVICPSQTVTVTIASPGVFTATAHGLVAGDKVHLSTTGGLPSNLAANTDYYVISAGLTTDAFELALTPGGAAINTGGSQSGVHTLYKSAYGKGDGSTTFNLPDFRSRTLLGKSASAPTTVLTFEGSQVDTGNDLITILDTVYPSQGQAVVLSTTGTLPAGLSPGTYYIVRASSTTIKFASSLANANAGTVVNITDTGSGLHTMTFTNRTHPVLGRNGGEETHGTALSETPAHTHVLHGAGNASAGGNGYITASNTTGSYDIAGAMGSTGGDGTHNNMSPFAVINFIIKT